MKSMPADGLAAFLESGIFGTSRFVGSFNAHIYQLTVTEKGLPLGKRCNAVPPDSRFFALREVENPSIMASLSSATQNASKWKPGWLMPLLETDVGSQPLACESAGFRTRSCSKSKT
jgi:hypothetical protein